MLPRNSDMGLCTSEGEAPSCSYGDTHAQTCQHCQEAAADQDKVFLLHEVMSCVMVKITVCSSSGTCNMLPWRGKAV
jgi:hypothetical protein